MAAALMSQMSKPMQVAKCLQARPALAARTPLQQRFVHRKLDFRAAAAEAAEDLEEEDLELVDVDEDGEELVGSDSWRESKLAALEAAENSVKAEATHYSLNFMWMAKNIGVAVDQVFARGQRSPVTEYYFWPRKDAWEELKAALEAKTWISERERVLLLNKCTEVINYWQDETKHTVQEAQEKFSDCKILGS